MKMPSSSGHQDVLQNVMAALNVFGVEYDTRHVGFDTFEMREIPSYVKYRADFPTVGEDMAPFLEAFEAFRNHKNPGEKGEWKYLSGKGYVVEDATTVTVVLVMSYIRSNQELDDVAGHLGYSSYEECQYEYGDLPDPQVGMAVKVNAIDMDRFVREVAYYCWKR